MTQSTYQYDVTSRVSRVVTLKMANKVFVKEMGKVFEYLTNLLLKFLRFGDIEVSIFQNHLNIALLNVF